MVVLNADNDDALEMQQWIFEEVHDVVLEAPTEEDVLEAEILSWQQAIYSDVDLSSILLSANAL